MSALNLKDKLNSKKILESAAKILESERYIKAENGVFKFTGVTPYEKQYRDPVDWLYLFLWIVSVLYQFLLLACFFFYPSSHWFSGLLEIFYDPFFIGVSGYGVFNIIHRYYPHSNRRRENVKTDIERRKRRNGHRFIGYWWINFLIMLSAAASFNYSADLSGPMGTSLKISLTCSVIGFGYELTKRKLINADSENTDLSKPQIQASQ